MFIPKSRDDLFLLGNLHIVSRAIHIFSEFPIADYLSEGGKTAQEIATHFDFNELAIGKLLRVLASFNLVKEEDDSFSLTDLGQYLCHSHPETMKDLLFWDASRWSSFGKLEETLKTGETAFQKVFGEGYFEYLSKHPKLQKRFDEHMRAVSYDEDQVLANEIPLKETASFIDLGGGEGGLVSALIDKRKDLQATLFDLPETIDALSPTDLEGIYLKQGSFFEPIEGAYDAALLKRVLHDWDDVQCVEILSQAKKALKPGGKIYIIENILKGKEDSRLTRMFDLFLLTVFGGVERSYNDYTELIAQAGLQVSEMIDTSSLMSIIVAE